MPLDVTSSPPLSPTVNPLILVLSFFFYFMEWAVTQVHCSIGSILCVKVVDVSHILTEEAEGLSRMRNIELFEILNRGSV